MNTITILQCAILQYLLERVCRILNPFLWLLNIWNKTFVKFLGVHYDVKYFMLVNIVFENVNLVCF